jgi:DNA polymerase sigma
MIAEKIVVQSVKNCCVTNAFDGTEDDFLWDSSDLDCSVSKDDLEKYVLFDLLSHCFLKNLSKSVRRVEDVRTS